MNGKKNVLCSGGIGSQEWIAVRHGLAEIHYSRYHIGLEHHSTMHTYLVACFKKMDTIQ